MDVEWALDQLELFVKLTEPRNASGGGYVTSQSFAKSPRTEVLTQWVVVEAILGQVHPNWRTAHGERSTYEFAQKRDAAVHAIALLRRSTELEQHLEPSSPTMSSDNLHPWVWEPARPLWRDGHYRAAVQTAATGVDGRLQDLLDRRDVSGRDLVLQALSNDPPKVGRPRLRVPDQGNEQTTQSFQDGLRSLGEACFLAIRNPSSHVIDSLSEQEALEQLAVMSLFARWVTTCRVDE